MNARADALPVPAAPSQDEARLDELMLAMDVVDTLRHDQALVEAELSDEDRDRRFVARLKEIYAGQGIEVSDAVIAEGVAALKQDRFLYLPPPNSFSVRLAHLYIERGRWARRGLLAAALAGFGYFAVTAPGAYLAERRYAEYLESVDATLARARALPERIDTIRRDLAVARESPPALAAALVQGAAQRAESSLEQAAAVAAGIAAALGTTRVDAEAFGDAPDEARSAGGRLEARIGEGSRALEAAAREIESIREAGALATRAERVQAQLQATQLSDVARAAVDPVWQRASAAFAAADLATARAGVERLEQIAGTVNLAYELRIVSRPGARSGVWRHPVDNPRGRNYYIVVEAIGPDGERLALPITNEETQRTETVREFAIRVPEAVYDRVRDDKQDNGLIDEPIVGEKRRGELEPLYRVAIAGGAITDW